MNFPEVHNARANISAESREISNYPSMPWQCFHGVRRLSNSLWFLAQFRFPRRPCCQDFSGRALSLSGRCESPYRCCCHCCRRGHYRQHQTPRPRPTAPRTISWMTSDIDAGTAPLLVTELFFCHSFSFQSLYKSPSFLRSQDAKYSDAGEYTCRAENLFGSVSAHYDLSVVPAGEAETQWILNWRSRMNCGWDLFVCFQNVNKGKNTCCFVGK